MLIIEDIKIEKKVFPLKKPYALSFAVLSEFISLQVEIILNSGESRVAEVVPLYGYSNETEESILNFLQKAKPELINLTLAEARSYLAPLILVQPFSVSPFLSAIDLFDEQVSDCALNSGDSFIIPSSLKEPAFLKQLLKESSDQIIKIKVTGDSLYDIEALSQIKNFLSGSKNIRIDINQAYSYQDAVNLCKYFGTNNLWDTFSYIEQPFPANSWQATENLIQEFSEAKIMLDESIVTLDDVKRAKKIGVEFIKLKLFKQGGIFELIDLSRYAKELGLKSLTQVSELTGQSLQTLTNWFNDKPELFDVVL